MFAPPPKMTRIILNSKKCKAQIEFYEKIGMLFHKEIFENGLKKFTYIYDDFQFEIREVRDDNEVSKNLELRFLIDDIEVYLEGVRQIGIQIIKDIWITENHKHIQLKDLDNNKIELMTKK